MPGPWRPGRPFRARGGVGARALGGRGFTGPLSPAPQPPSQPSRLAGGLGAHSPSPPTLIGRGRRFGAPAPRRRSAGAFRRPAPSPNPPHRGAASYGGAGWWAGGRERGVSGRLSGALRASVVFAALLLLELLRARPSPSSPHPAPSRWPGFTVIPLGAFTGNTSEGQYKNFARAGSRENSGGVSVLWCGRRLPGLYYSVVRPLNRFNGAR